jgi:hypothetical protein
MSVRDRGRAAELAEIQKQIDAGTTEPERRPYSGAGSAFMGKIGQPLQDTSGMTRRQIAEQKARGEFARPIDDAAEEARLAPLLKAIADDNQRVLRDHQALTDLICSKRNLDSLWIEQGHPEGCPLLLQFTRGRGDASSYTATAFFQGPFKDFLNSNAAFAKYRHTSVEQTVLSIILDWMGIQYIDELDADNWGKLLLLMEGAHFVLPEPPVEPRRVKPTVAERIQYTVGGRTLIGKDAIAALPSAEFARRLKEEKDFANLVELVETGQTPRSAVIANDEKPADYATRLVLRNFPVTVGISKRGEEFRNLTMAQVEHELRADDYTRAMKLLGTPVKTFEATQDTDGYIAEHLAARRQQWAR